MMFVDVSECIRAGLPFDGKTPWTLAHIDSSKSLCWCVISSLDTVYIPPTVAFAVVMETPNVMTLPWFMGIEMFLPMLRFLENLSANEFHYGLAGAPTPRQWRNWIDHVMDNVSYVLRYMHTEQIELSEEIRVAAEGIQRRKQELVAQFDHMEEEQSHGSD